MADKLEVTIELVEDEPPFNRFLPYDEVEWWQKQLGGPLEALEPEPALH